MKDFELPNGFQDADLEMNSLQETANRASKLRKQGICCHGHRQCGNERNDVPLGKTKCLECGKLATWEELEEERKELLA